MTTPIIIIESSPEDDTTLAEETFTTDGETQDDPGVIVSAYTDANSVTLSALPKKSQYFKEVVPVEEFGPPVLIKETITSHKQLRQRLRELERINTTYEQVVLFFVGTPDRNGRSWHADCNIVDRAVNYMLKKLQIGGYFLKIHVGNRDEWLDLDNPFKVDKKVKLLNIPTLAVWNSCKRIFGKRCLDLETIYLLLKD